MRDATPAAAAVQPQGRCQAPVGADGEAEFEPGEDIHAEAQVVTGGLQPQVTGAGYQSESAQPA